MQMDAGLDTGDMLSVQKLPITDADTTATLHDRMAELGGTMIVQALEQVAAGQLQAIPQPTEGVNYAHKIEKHEAAIDWNQDAATIVRRIRAFNPFPGATAVLRGETVKIWNAHVASAGDGSTIKIEADLAVTPAGIAVEAINSIVIITELQRAGGKRMAASEFVRGMGWR